MSNAQATSWYGIIMDPQNEMSATNHRIMSSDSCETIPTLLTTIHDSVIVLTLSPEIVLTTSTGVEMCPVLGPHLSLSTASNLPDADAEDAEANANLVEKSGGYVEADGVGYVEFGERWVLGHPFLGTDGLLYDLNESGEYVAAVFPPSIFVRQRLDTIEEQSEVSDSQSQTLESSKPLTRTLQFHSLQIQSSTSIS